jgi:hypothetical protein
MYKKNFFLWYPCVRVLSRGSNKNSIPLKPFFFLFICTANFLTRLSYKL